MPRTYSRSQVFLASLHPGKLMLGEGLTWISFYDRMEKNTTPQQQNIYLVM